MVIRVWLMVRINVRLQLTHTTCICPSCWNYGSGEVTDRKILKCYTLEPVSPVEISDTLMMQFTPPALRQLVCLNWWKLHHDRTMVLLCPFWFLWNSVWFSSPAWFKIEKTHLILSVTLACSSCVQWMVRRHTINPAAFCIFFYLTMGLVVSGD